MLVLPPWKCSSAPPVDGDVGALSGGWKMRVALARVLLGMPREFGTAIVGLPGLVVGLRDRRE